MASKDWPQCLHAGRLRQRVTIEQPTTPTNGETNPSYSTFVANVASEVIETSGGEYIRGRQVEAGVKALVTIRYRDGVIPTMRVKYGSRYLYIMSVVDPTGYKAELLLSCGEVQP